MSEFDRSLTALPPPGGLQTAVSSVLCPLSLSSHEADVDQYVMNSLWKYILQGVQKIINSWSL